MTINNPFPQLQPIQPTWGQSLGKGIEGGFEAAVQGLLKGKELAIQKSRYARADSRDNLEFIQKTGYNPDDLEAGRQIAEHYNPGPQAAENLSMQGLGTLPGMGGLPEIPGQAPVPQLTQGQQNHFKNYTEFTNRMRETAAAKSDMERAQAEWYRNMMSAMGDQPKTTKIGNAEYIVQMGRGGPRYIPVAMQKGDESAVKDTQAALQALTSVDDYFNSIEDAWAPKAASISEGLPGAVRDIAFPDVAQTENKLFTAYQFSIGGKQLTDSERRTVKKLGSQFAYGPEQRAAARINLKRMLVRNLESTMNANLLGPEKDRTLGELNRIKASWRDPALNGPPTAKGYYDLLKSINPDMSDDDAYALIKARGLK